MYWQHRTNNHQPVPFFAMQGSPNCPYDTFYFVASVCTVDLDTQKRLAAARTVARFSIMYSASSMARSSMSVLNCTTPGRLVISSYAREARFMRPKAKAGLAIRRKAQYNQATVNAGTEAFL